MERGGKMVIKKSKWQYPQTPRILQLPRRQSVRRSKGKTTVTTPSSLDQRVKLEVLFHEERTFDRGMVNDEGRRRGKVADGREIGVVVDEVEEAKWRFQAEMLRSECNLLRIEKEIALKKMERRKKRMERTIRSAVHTLVSGKQRISEGKVMEDEISYLIEKLNELKSPKVKEMEGRNVKHNFDRQASVLRREIEKFDEEVCVRGIQKMAEASFSVESKTLADQNVLRNNSGNVSDNNSIITLSSKMEALSKGVLLERMEKECLFTPSSSSMYNSKAIKAHEEKKDCSRHCKAVMKKIADEVRAEAEQWSQMQGMLNQVRKEMEELQTCRDFWQKRALDSDSQIENLHSSVDGWRRKALSSDAKMKTLQGEVYGLQEEIEILRKERKLEPEKNKLPSESEKRVLICRLKENRHSNNGDWSKYNEGGRTTKPSSSRPPLREVKNNSVAPRQRSSNVIKT